MKTRIVVALLLTASFLAASLVLSLEAEQPKKKFDVGKGFVEGPLKDSLTGSTELELYPGRKVSIRAPKAALAEKKLDVSKGRVVEAPLKLTVATSTGEFKNPQVAPGKVRWHADIQTACAAAKKTGRPVLVFHMIGKLEDRFC